MFFFNNGARAEKKNLIQKLNKFYFGKDQSHPFFYQILLLVISFDTNLCKFFFSK